MGGLLSGLFGGGGDSKKQLQEMQKQRELTQISQARQRQQQQDSAAQTAGQLTAAKATRGQRLLMSSTSEGGLATTLGGA